MSIDKCLDTALEAGEITKADVTRLRALYEEARARHAGADGAQAARDELAETLTRDAVEKKRRAHIAASVHKRLLADLDAYRTARGEKDVAEAAVALLEHYGSAPFASVEGRRKTIVARSHGRLDALLASFERTMLAGATPNRARLENVVREVFGEDTGDAAAQALARAWLDEAELLRQRFNRGGGAIAKLDDWGMPQTHDRLALLRAGRDNWKAAIRPLLAPERMRRGVSGQPVSEGELDAILDDVWDAIVTDGWATREPQKRPFGMGALAGRHAGHRFLVFKDAAAWMRYQGDFGEGDAFATMMQHINLMARDTAALEILGPNPNATIAFVKQAIEKEAALKEAGKAGARFAGSPQRARARAARKSRTVENMWQTMRGSVETAAATGPALFFAGMRNWVTASVLGSAILSAVPTDPIYQAIARKMAGLPASKTLLDIARAHGKGTRRQAVRSGLILDSAMHVLGTEARYAGTLSGDRFTRWIADRSLAFSGLTAFTQAGRHSFGLEFMATMADQAKTPWSGIPKWMRRVFGRYGLDEAAWDALRKADLYEPETGSTFLRPHEIAALDEPLAERVLEMILMETEYAVPSSTVRGRSSFIGVEQPGTLWGEIKRSAAMFKSFGVTFALLYGGRMWRETRGGQDWAAGAAYGGAILATTTLGGMLSLWLKDVAAGRDPRPIFDETGNPAKFMGAAFLQGGGFGIYGDFLFADLNRYGGGLATQIGGPVVERGTDALNLTVGNAVQLAAGEDTRFAEELRRFVGGNTPFASLWYAKLGWQRLLLDQLQTMTDPNANKSFKRRQSYWRKNYGTDHWWRPGEAAPDRLPSLSMMP